MSLPSELLKTVKDIAGDDGCLTGRDRIAPFEQDVRGTITGRAAAVLRPASTEQLSHMVRACAEHRVAMVPHGGNTGYMGGSMPDDSGDQAVISLTRLNQIRGLDSHNFTLTAEAGCILENLQQAAENADRLFPLSLGAKGSCQIGGNLSTNAGGTNVLRYGNTRDLVLGLEVVLPDGRIWHGLHGLRKDNTGYDLKQWFIGAEGTLGIISAAVLKLFPRPQHTVVAMVAVPDPTAAVNLLGHLRDQTGDLVSGFEYMHGSVLELARQHLPNSQPPLANYQHVVLVEISGGAPGIDLAQITETALASAWEKEWIEDAVVASNVAQQRQFWQVREHLPEAMKHAGTPILFDVSVPVSSVPAFLERATAIAETCAPTLQVLPFGHVGDGNIHFDLVLPHDAPPVDLPALTATITERINDLVAELDGSISAEHGIGSVKRDTLARYRDPLEIEMMRRLKRTLDPQNLMNPGKILSNST